MSTALMVGSARYVLDLRHAHDAAQVGGKAVNLAHLLAADLPVPGGFVVSTEAFRAIRAGGDVAALWAEVDAAYRAMGGGAVAVRSSATAEDLATASMAGQYDTILDVRGEHAVHEAIVACWDSIASDRVASYLSEHAIDRDEVSMAVVVQRLVPADCAGVLFTVNPRTADPTEMLLEASPGLGEALVSGAVQPDTLVLDAASGAVREARHVAERGCLDSRAVHGLWDLACRVAKHFGSAQDIEWAIHQGEILLLQSRAITTLGEIAAQRRCRQALHDQVRAARAAGAGPWLVHNLSETLPQPTRLTWSIIKQFMSGAGGFGDLYRRVGYTPGPLACDQGVLDLIGGRIYLDCSRAPEMFTEGFPFSYDLLALRDDPEAGQSPPSVPSGSLGARVAAARQGRDVAAQVEAMAPTLVTQFREETVPAWRAWLNQEREVDCALLTNEELLTTIERRRDRVLDVFAPDSLVPGFVIAQLMGRLHTVIAEELWDRPAAEYVRQLLVAAEPDATVRSNHDLHALGRGTLSKQEWLSRHGHRALGEFELAVPRWCEASDAVMPMATRIAAGPEPLAQHEAQAQRVAELIAELVPRFGDRADEFMQLVHLLRIVLPLREDAKDELMRGYALLRAAVCEAGRRLGIGDDVFALAYAELKQAVTLGYAPLEAIAQAQQQRAHEGRLQLPRVIDDAVLDDITAPPQIEHADVYAAFAISPGRGCGPVRIVDDPATAGDLGADYVLVCRSTDPAWTPLFARAAGLVLECGGSLSHGAVVAREMGIPAVVLAGARSLLHDGDTITVDGDGARVIRGQELTASAVEVVAPIPPAGPRERALARWRNRGAVLWLGYLAACFALPEAWLYQPSIAAMDVVLWPLVRTLGQPGAVAALAAIVAVASLLAQRLLSDHARLVCARTRAQDLRVRAAQLPREHQAAVLAPAAGVQGRLAAAAFAPLALALGPLVMIFLWLPLRVDPAAWSKPPGSSVVVRASVPSESTAGLSLRVAGSGAPEPMLHLARGQESYRELQPLAEPLRAFRVELQADRGDDQLDWSLAAVAASQRQALIDGLDALLAGPMPVQTVQWHLDSVPGRSGAAELLIEDGTGVVTRASVVLGDAEAPAPTVVLPDAASAVTELSVVARGRTLEDDRVPAFFSVFDIDIGWLGVYLLAYLPAMLLTKRALRVP
ncbi:MAG: PEP-utilizing enzyme [Planctomycetota bacterium]|nr:PEP-utilizing enzyme [Planctomycetota bacterium]